MLGRRGVYPEVAALYEAFSTGKLCRQNSQSNMRICRVAAAVAARGGARYSAELLEAATKRR